MVYVSNSMFWHKKKNNQEQIDTGNAWVFLLMSIKVYIISIYNKYIYNKPIGVSSLSTVWKAAKFAV